MAVQQASVNEERDEDTGKFTTKYPAEEFLGALGELGGAGSTSDVAETVGCPTRTAHYNLSNLEEEGKVGSRNVGNARLWMLASDE